MQRDAVSSAFPARASLLAMACAIATCFSLNALAQNAAVSDAALQEIVVTGSRIASTDLQAYQPVEVVTTEAIESSGTTNIATLLRDLPAVGTSGLNSASSNFLTNDAGVNTINLRNLGDQRTLVLVNGRRMTPGVGSTTEVDLNEIPTDFIEKVEVETGGASAIYGSDAMAGVVNFVYKKDLDGLYFHGQAGQSSEADAQDYTGSVTWGGTIGDGRGHAMLNVSYDKNAGLQSSQRAVSAIDQTETGSGLHTQFSSYNPQGNFFVNSCCLGNFDEGGDEFSFAANGSLIDGGGGAGYNRSAERQMIVPVDRTLVSSVFNYDLAEHAQGYAEVTYADAVTHSKFEPIPLSSSGANGVYNGATDANGDTIGIPITNWYLNNLPVLAPIASEIGAWNAMAPNCTGNETNSPNSYDCVNYVTFRRRLTDLGDRGADSTRQTFRVVLGVNGDLPFGDWKYDASYVYGRTTDAEVSPTGGVNLQNFANALNSVAGPNNTPVCADPVAVSQGCVPINVFGVNSITPAMAAYVVAPVTRNASVAEQVITGTIQGSLFELPAGKVPLVVGLEDRSDRSSVVWDPLTNEGLNSSNALPNVAGSLGVYEFFMETELPILKDLPGAHNLSFDGAYRHADYSEAGAADTWKVGLKWSPIADLSFRGVYSVAVRAPDISELFGGQAQTFPPGIVDPCDGITAGSTGQVATACKAIPGIAAAIAASPTHTFAYTALDYQQIFGLQGSNPSLNTEQAKTKTVGIVVTPTALPNFSMTVDWFDITVFGAVASVNFETSISDCITSGQFCSNVIRNAASGKIQELLQLNLNVGYIRSEGIDTTARYTWSLDGTPIGGRLGLTLTETHQMRLEQAVPGAPIEIDLGQLNQTGRLGAGFRDRGSIMVDYARGGFDATYKLDYLGVIQDTNYDNAGVTPINDQYNNVPAYFYSNLQLGYKFGDKGDYQAYLGANNLFNKKPPYIPSGYASDITGTQTAADTYDLIGVFMYAGFRLKF